MATNPIMGFLKTILLFITGRVQFIEHSIGRKFVLEDKKTFIVFRHVKIKPFWRTGKEPEAVFKIRFKPRDMSIEENKRFSRLPMLVFMGFRGFSSKFWMVEEETGLCQGIYEWQTMKDAENYARSIAVTFMTKRSEPGSVSFEIIPQGKARDSSFA